MIISQSTLHCHLIPRVFIPIVQPLNCVFLPRLFITYERHLLEPLEYHIASVFLSFLYLTLNNALSRWRSWQSSLYSTSGHQCDHDKCGNGGKESTVAVHVHVDEVLIRCHKDKNSHRDRWMISIIQCMHTLITSGTRSCFW